MTELEHVLKKHNLHLIAICKAAYVAKYNHTCDGKYCKECDLCANINKILKILLSEHKEKPQLTDDEKAILRSLPKKWEYMLRNCNNKLFLTEGKPKKRDACYWDYKGSLCDLNIFNHLFSFVKQEDEEPWNIKELLEEVKANE